jgi:NADPH-dependent 2,4-dienoyl-CoA reductase/sulfur reductase-like enzyme
VGKSVQALAEKNGVKFELSAHVKEIRSDNKAVSSVELEDKSVPTDLLIFATGVRPSTESLGNIELDFTVISIIIQNGGVKTNLYLKTSNPDVYAAGDVASFPYWPTGSHARFEHWNQAIYEGSIAALNMLGKKIPIDNIPFFWTRSFNTSVQFTGITVGYDNVHISGDLATQKFIAYYLKNGKVVGAATKNSLNSVMIINEALKQGVMPNAETIKQPDFTLDSVVPLINSKKPTCTKC